MNITDTMKSYVSFLFWICILISCKEGFSLPCVLKDYGDDKRVCVCNATYCDTLLSIGTLNENEYVVFTSSKEGLRFNMTTGKFSQNKDSDQTEQSFFSKIIGTITNLLPGKQSIEFIIDTENWRQTIFGFGGAFTDSAGINILSLSENAQENLLRSYFSEEGIGYNLCRIPIGGTDFSTRAYSLDDGPTDPNLENFKLAPEDLQYKIPLIKRAMQMSSRDIHCVSTTWSPPNWMKTNDNTTGFSLLRPEFYSTYANYTLRAVDEYAKRGIKIWAVSTGNEPLNGIIPLLKINCLGWTPKTLSKWVTYYLGPQFRNSIYNETLLLAYDDQRSYLPWWIERMVKADPKVLQYLDGTAVHWYMDFLVGPEVIEALHNKFPQKYIMYTEASEGYQPWQKKVDIGSWDRGEKYITNIIQNINTWVTTWMDWNLAVSLTGGPNWANNFVESPILVNTSADEFYKQPTYYAMAHVAKYIQRDAVVFRTTPTDSSGIHVMSVQNPDKKIVIVLASTNSDASQVSIKVGKKGWIKLEVPPYSFLTVLA